MNEFTYDVAGIEYELITSRNTGKEMLKQIFFDEDFRTIHKNYLIGDEGCRLIINMLKNPLDFLELGKDGRTPEALYLLLTEHQEYFRTPVTITLFDDGSKYKKIKALSYE